MWVGHFNIVTAAQELVTGKYSHTSSKRSNSYFGTPVWYSYPLAPLHVTALLPYYYTLFLVDCAILLVL